MTTTSYDNRENGEAEEEEEGEGIATAEGNYVTEVPIETPSVTTDGHDPNHGELSFYKHYLKTTTAFFLIMFL